MLSKNTPTISSFCSADKPQCVEVTYRDSGIEVRDTKQADQDEQVVEEFTDAEWRSMLHGWKQVERIIELKIGDLEFTLEEAEAFIAGAKAGDFDVPEPGRTVVVTAEPGQPVTRKIQGAVTLNVDSGKIGVASSDV